MVLFVVVIFMFAPLLLRCDGATEGLDSIHPNHSSLVSHHKLSFLINSNITYSPNLLDLIARLFVPKLDQPIWPIKSTAKSCWFIYHKFTRDHIAAFDMKIFPNQLEPPSPQVSPTFQDMLS